MIKSNTIKPSQDKKVEKKKILKSTKVTILYREYAGGGRMMRTIVNGNKDKHDEDFKPIKKWIARDYLSELLIKDYEEN